jgi:TolB protein
MTADGTSVERLTRHVGDDRHPAWSPDGHRLVFVSSRSGVQELCVFDLRSGRASLLVELRGEESFPSWSPDGTWIAFSLATADEFDMYLIRPDGSDLRVLTLGPTRDVWPRWSPDGDRIAFFSRRDEERQDDDLYVLEVATGDVARITDKPGHDFCPTWAPDGTAIAAASIDVEGPRWIRIFDLSGAIKAEFGAGFYRATEPAWSPDGSRIAFAGRRTRDEPYQIYVQRVRWSTEEGHEFRRNLKEGNF